MQVGLWDLNRLVLLVQVGVWDLHRLVLLVQVGLWGLRRADVTCAGRSVGT